MDQVVLEAALQGLELQKQKLEEQIGHVRAMLGKRGPGRPKANAPAPIVAAAAPAEAKSARKPRVLSAAARKSIAMAQKRRWAEYHKQKEAEGSE
ncbi:MAG: hypothetical protein HY820_32580 [Acidobacteria bacterium]|nr:hypothetical protein [Acidobacteriota bacterium]